MMSAREALESTVYGEDQSQTESNRQGFDEAAQGPTYQQPSVDPNMLAMAKAMAAPSRHNMQRTAIRGGVVVLAGGLVLASCMASGNESSFGRHNNATVNTTTTTIGHMELVSDLTSANFYSTNDSTLGGTSYNCYNPIFPGILLPGMCIQDSVHVVSVHTDGIDKATAHAGAFNMTGYLDPSGNPYVTVDVDTTKLESSLSGTRHTMNTGKSHNIGLDGITAGLGLGNEDLQPTLQTDAETNGDDAMLASFTTMLEDDPYLVDEMFTQALRSQIGSNVGLLKVLDGNGAKLLSEMADPKTRYIFNHNGQRITIQTERPREFSPNKTYKIEGVKITFGKDKPITFSEQSAKLLASLRADTSVEVTNEPSLHN